MTIELTSEFERLGGKFPEDIESIIKSFARPRYMKPKHGKIMRECIFHDNGGWWPPALIPIWGVATEAQQIAMDLVDAEHQDTNELLLQIEQYLIDNNVYTDIQ